MRGTAASAVVALLLFASATANAGVAGEGTKKTVAAKRTTAAPTIDGKLDDAAWQTVGGDDRFTQSFPTDGAKPSMRTQLKLLYDDNALYIGVTAFDDTPKQIIARTARRDNRPDSDSLTILLDTRHDHDSGYQFWINAAGVLSDGQMHDDNRLNASWNGVWYGKASVHARGWSAELKIPYTILRFGKRGKQTWGINVQRYVSRTKEVMQWVHVPRTERGSLSRAGHITGVSGIEPPRTFELRPFAVTKIASLLPKGGGLGVGNDSSRAAEITGGVNLKYGITPNLTLDATVLPDFGQVEADPVFLNLTTFEVFLPERRPFFVENADLFNTDVNLFYSRRIGERLSGLGEDSETTTSTGETATVTDAPLAVPIWAATRITGKLSRRFTIAAINAVTGPEELDVRTESGIDTTVEPTPIRNYGAIRGKYSLGGSSYLGFIATSHNRTGNVNNPARDHDAYAESIDGRWVRKDGMYRLYFHVAASHRVGGPTYRETADDNGNSCTNLTCTHLTRADGTLQRPGDSGIGGEMGGGKVGGVWTVWANYSFRSPKFDVNDVGFENSWDYHRVFLDLGWRRQRRWSMFQTVNVNLRGQGRWGFDGLRQDGFVSVSANGLFHNFWSANWSATAGPPNRFIRRETSDGGRAEQAAWISSFFSVSSDSRKQLRGSAYAGASTATNDPAWNMSLGGSLSFRTDKHFTMSVNTGYNRSKNDLRFYSCTDLSGRECSVFSMERDYLFTRLTSESLSVTARGTWAMSTWMSLELYAQLFGARGSYRDAQLLPGVLGSKPYLRRADVIDSPENDDLIRASDFSFNNLNMNLLWRWEFKPGNTIIAVYTRATSASRDSPTLTFRGLARARTEEVGLLKLSLLFQ